MQFGRVRGVSLNYNKLRVPVVDQHHRVRELIEANPRPLQFDVRMGAVLGHAKHIRALLAISRPRDGLPMVLRREHAAGTRHSDGSVMSADLQGELLLTTHKFTLDQGLDAQCAFVIVVDEVTDRQQLRIRRNDDICPSAQHEGGGNSIRKDRAIAFLRPLAVQTGCQGRRRLRGFGESLPIAKQPHKRRYVGCKETLSG